MSEDIVFDLTVPEGWVGLEPPPGCAFLAGEPGADELRPCTSVTFEAVGAGTRLRSYYDAQRARAGGLITDRLAIDERETTLAGRPAIVETVAFRQGRSGLTLRQWTAIVGGTAIMLAGVCPNARWPGLEPEFDAIARSFAPEAPS